MTQVRYLNKDTVLAQYHRSSRLRRNKFDEVSRVASSRRIRM
jgi:hypothetical protein